MTSPTPIIWTCTYCESPADTLYHTCSRSALGDKIRQLRREITDLKTLLGAERDRFGKLETELLGRIQKLSEAGNKALSHILDFGSHNHEVICICGYCELKRALAPTPSVPSADTGGKTSD